MQCVSCRFENMPGVTACGRCGSPLRLDTLVADVHPPRATARQKRLRNLFGWHTLASRSSVTIAPKREPDIPRSGVPWLPLGVIVRCLVPGWAQFYLGERLAGRVFLGIYLPLALLSLVYLGTHLGGLVLGLAFTVHVAACVSVLRTHGLAQAFTARGVLISIVGLVGLYVVAGWLLTRVATPLVLHDDYSPFRDGDVLIYNPSAYGRSSPRVGDLVCYQQYGLRMNVTENLNHVNFVIGAGPRIDRLLAGPGDVVHLEKGFLTINGERPSAEPLTTARPDVKLGLTVPQDHYFVLPGIFGNQVQALPPEYLRAAMLVPRTAIEGRIYFRLQPLARLGRIH